LIQLSKRSIFIQGLRTHTKTYKLLFFLFSMKKFKCPDCEKTFESETSKEALGVMHPHYMSEHKDIISNADESQKKAWMEKFNKDWEETEEIK